MASRRPKITAIMAAYNAEKTIAESIERIDEQTFEDWELIVVDDASTDLTWDVLSRFSKHPQISTVRLDRNGGPAVARNTAIARASGDFIAICDSDDISLPERFEKQVTWLEAHPDIDVVSSQMLYFSEDEAPFSFVRFPEDPVSARRRLRRGSIGVAHNFSMIRKSCFERYGGYSSGVPGAEDLELFMRFDRFGVRFQTLPEILGLYRKHGERWTHPPLDQRAKMEFQRYYAMYRAGFPQNSGSSKPLTFEQYSSLRSSKARVYGMGLIRSLLFTLRSGLTRTR
jgi:glycosyltransferase involved in cell wall biosynthesis